MEAARERLYALMVQARAGYLARLRSAGVVALLLAALLWFTKWPSLRAGLIVLLAGQIGLMIFLLRRSFVLVREMKQVRASLVEKNTFTSWFDAEARFATRLGVSEDLVRTAGFLILGYGFWTATGSALIALALGVAYPAFAYFAMERRKHNRAKRILQAEKDAVAALLDAR